MNILITGDWHYRKKKPRNRRDKNYQDTIDGKIRSIFGVAVKYGCVFILQPGDMFDDVDISDNTKRQFLMLMQDAPCPIFTIPGQHDLRDHSRKWKNTPMGVIDAAGDIVTVVHEPIEQAGFTLYPAGFGDPVPEPDPDDPFSILMCHKLVIKTQQPYAYDYFADEMLKKYKYDLIVSGDNHQHFIATDSHRTLINCGSLMRTRIDQKDHHPHFYIYNIQHGAIVTSGQVDHLPFDEVMDVKKAEEEEEKNENLQSFIERVRETKDDQNNEEFNFKNRLASRMRRSERAIGDGPMGILKEVMNNDNWTNE